MANQEVIAYITQQLSFGISQESISTTLKTQGWSDTDISEAFTLAQNPPQIEPVIAPTAPRIGHTNTRKILGLVALIVTLLALIYGIYVKIIIPKQTEKAKLVLIQKEKEYLEGLREKIRTTDKNDIPVLSEDDYNKLFNDTLLKTIPLDGIKTQTSNGIPVSLSFDDGELFAHLVLPGVSNFNTQSDNIYILFDSILSKTHGDVLNISENNWEDEPGIFTDFEDVSKKNIETYPYYLMSRDINLEYDGELSGLEDIEAFSGKVIIPLVVNAQKIELTKESIGKEIPYMESYFELVQWNDAEIEYSLSSDGDPILRVFDADNQLISANGYFCSTVNSSRTCTIGFDGTIAKIVLFNGQLVEKEYPFSYGITPKTANGTQTDSTVSPDTAQTNTAQVDISSYTLATQEEIQNARKNYSETEKALDPNKPELFFNYLDTVAPETGKTMNAFIEMFGGNITEILTQIKNEVFSIESKKLVNETGYWYKQSANSMILVDDKKDLSKPLFTFKKVGTEWLLDK